MTREREPQENKSLHRGTCKIDKAYSDLEIDTNGGDE